MPRPEALNRFCGELGFQGSQAKHIVRIIEVIGLKRWDEARWVKGPLL